MLISIFYQQNIKFSMHIFMQQMQLTMQKDLILHHISMNQIDFHFSTNDKQKVVQMNMQPNHKMILLLFLLILIP